MVFGDVVVSSTAEGFAVVKDGLVLSLHSTGGLDEQDAAIASAMRVGGSVRVNVWLYAEGQYTMLRNFRAPD